MKKILTYGTYDLLHFGHINLLKRARELGDYLIVGLSTDEFKEKKGKKSYFPYNTRKYMVESVRFVDEVIPESNWEQKIEDIKKYNIDIFVMGDDWKGQFDYLNDLCEVVYLERTSDVCSTNTKKHLKSKEQK